jgi:hypothetical protein
MRHSIRLSIGAAAIMALAACSHSEQPALSDDLKQDLAKVGGGDVQLAGAPAARTDIVSAAERTNGAVPAPRARAVSRAPSAVHGAQAVVHSVRHVTPAASSPAPRAEVAPAEEPTAAPAPEPVPASAGRPEAPHPSTQREPRGGWKTMGDIIRNAPFPINPATGTRN